MCCGVCERVNHAQLLQAGADVLAVQAGGIKHKAVGFVDDRRDSSEHAG